MSERLMLPKLPVDRERTPWPCKKGRFARGEDAVLNYAWDERFGVIIVPRFPIEIRNMA